MADTFDLVLERTLDAPRDLVWAAQTQPEHLKHWFAPKPYEITEAEVDLKPGGIFRVRMFGPDGFDNQGLTNLAFGGPNRTTLFISGFTQGSQGGLYSVELNVPGLPY